MQLYVIRFESPAHRGVQTFLSSPAASWSVAIDELERLTGRRIGDLRVQSLICLG